VIAKLYAFGKKEFKNGSSKTVYNFGFEIFYSLKEAESNAIKIPTSILLMSLLERNCAMASSVVVAGAVKEKDNLSSFCD
jgi:hypothetical protein